MCLKKNPTNHPKMISRARKYMRRSEYQRKQNFDKVDKVLTVIFKRINKSMNKPIQSFRNKGVDVAIWSTNNGGNSITIRKTYKDKQTNQYKESKYFYKDEVEGLIELLKSAVAFCDARAAAVVTTQAPITDEDIPF